MFISYGQRSNDQLVQFYGFVEEDNPDDVYVFGAELGDVLRSIGVDVSEKLSSTEMAVGPVVLLRSPLGFNETVQKTLESLLGSKDRVEAVLKDLCEHALEVSVSPSLLHCWYPKRVVRFSTHDQVLSAVSGTFKRQWRPPLRRIWN